MMMMMIEWEAVLCIFMFSGVINGTNTPDTIVKT
jgi:hypothetical protein